MSTDAINEIRQSLAVVLGRTEGNLAEAIQVLDSLKVETSGHLSHYLTKRSYEKAWILLDGDNPEKGGCGR